MKRWAFCRPGKTCRAKKAIVKMAYSVAYTILTLDGPGPEGWRARHCLRNACIRIAEECAREIRTRRVRSTNLTHMVRCYDSALFYIDPVKVFFIFFFHFINIDAIFRKHGSCLEKLEGAGNTDIKSFPLSHNNPIQCFCTYRNPYLPTERGPYVYASVLNTRSDSS